MTDGIDAVCPSDLPHTLYTHACARHTHPVEPEEAALVLGRVLQVEGRGDAGVQPAPAHGARRGERGGERGGDGEVGGGGAVLAAGEGQDRLEEKPAEEHLGPEGLALRGARGDGRQDLADDGVGPEGGVRGGGAGEGAQELLVRIGF